MGDQFKLGELSKVEESEPWKERRKLKRDVIRILLPRFEFEREEYLNLS